MHDDNWELINGRPAHHIEQLNAINTINLIEALVTLLVARRDPSQLPLMPSESALKEIHRCSTIFLLSQPGEYRIEEVIVQEGTEIVYRPPPANTVAQHMGDFFKELRGIWHTGDALDVAAFTLWRVNWVHPFKNGNGRTARAFSYACLCARLGVMLPGRTTIIDQIMRTRSEYEACIREADKAVEIDNGRNLTPMREYIDRLLQVQIASIDAAATKNG